MKTCCFLLACCCMVAIGATALGRGDASDENRTRSIPKFASLECQEREDLLTQLIQERLDRQTELVGQLDADNPKEANFAIAFLLGFHRMERAVPHLSKFITLETDATEQSREGLWERYPAAEALIHIGVPAIPEMIKNIETSDDEKVRKLSARVIRHVDGREIAIFRLEKTIERQPDPAKKAKLKAAIKSIEELNY
jgi:hypothetical protein